MLALVVVLLGSLICLSLAATVLRPSSAKVEVRRRIECLRSDHPTFI